MTQLKIITSPSGARFTVASDYADKFSGLVSDLEAQGYGINPKASGGYNPRSIRGSNRPSNHAFGRAIDINWDRNALGSKGEIPAELARSLAAKHGMTWGGDWSRRDPMHFEIANATPVPVSQRGIAQVAGVSQTQPTTTGAPEPMPTYKNVGGVVAPQEVSRQQQLAKALMAGGMDQPNPRHWSEALGNVLMSGVGMYKGQQAADAEAQGQASGNQALAQMLMGGDASGALANPYSAETAQKYQNQQELMRQRTQEAERLQRMKIEAQNADPMRQLQMENLRSQIRTREAGGAAAIKAGQKAQAEADMKEQGKRSLSDQLDSVVSSYLKLDQMGGVTNPDRGWLDNVQTSLGTSAIGQTLGKMAGTESQSLRERINNARPLLIQGIRQATGMSARAMDSNRELDFYLQAATDPGKDLYSNLAAIEVLDRTYGLGNLLESMVAGGTLPSEVYERVKQQAALSMQQRPIAVEQPANSRPPIDVPQGDGIPVISDPQQARGLPKGTRFRTPDGRVMEVP